MTYNFTTFTTNLHLPLLALPEVPAHPAQRPEVRADWGQVHAERRPPRPTTAVVRPHRRYNAVPQGRGGPDRATRVP